MIVEGRLGNTRLGDDAVYADDMDAFGIEKARGGIEQAAAGGADGAPLY